MNDTELVAMYWSRDEQAIAETEKLYGGYLTRIADNILADRQDAEECVNDTYLRTWNSIPTNRPNILRLYLGRITRQLSIDLYRRKHADKRGASRYAASLEELGDLISDSATAEDAAQAAALRDSIAAFVASLPKERQMMFVGRYYYFDSMKQIAQYCGVPEGSVKSVLYRLRCALRDHLSKEGFEV